MRGLDGLLICMSRSSCFILGTSVLVCHTSTWANTHKNWAMSSRWISELHFVDWWRECNLSVY